jgi:coproporphyrinogen III oxidase
MITAYSNLGVNTMREKCRAFLRELQQRICAALEDVDGSGFMEDTWDRPGGGGGISRVLSNGAVLEKGGVNFSEVHGELEDGFSSELPGEGSGFYATGVSLVLHPRNPRAPTVHANFRYIEKGDRKWFGGGADLTPHYLYEEDAVHFHRTWKNACNLHGEDIYPRYKKECDEYFYLPHRGECRGVGGIFFDYVDADDSSLAMWESLGGAFVDSYLPILQRRKDEPHGEAERLHQLQRRGRYAEFNLVYDRGTIFGLKTGGRIESILMSLPPEVRWDYDVQHEDGSEEAQLLDVLRNPRDWLGEQLEVES